VGDPLVDGMELFLRQMGGEDINAAVDEMGKQRQQEFADSSKEAVSRLPKTGSINAENLKAEFEALGFKFGKEIDNVFVEVILPEGWKIKPTDHYMWSDLCDGKDRIRGHIFFKPDFWDRNGHVSLRQRYTAGCKLDYDWLHQHRDEYEDKADAYNDTPHTATVEDYDGTVLWQEGPVTARQLGVDWRTGTSGHGIERDLRHLARAWVSVHFPKWEDATAYWDGE
jgi:hypothetical protein